MVLLNDLLNASDLSQAVNGLAGEFREKHGLPKIHQLGLVVPDVEEAARTLEDRGIGPFFVADGSPVSWRERGQERSFRGKMGLAHYKGFELELLEPGHGSDFYRQSLDPAGGIVVQHLGLLAQDVDEWAGKLAAVGMPVWVRGRLKMGPAIADFSYMDTVKEAGIVVEFICWRLWGRVFTPPASMMRSAGWLEKRTGKRSITIA